MRKYTKLKSAFTLIEISIAITIITLLMLGIMQGGSLITKAKVQSAASLTKSSVVGKMDNLLIWWETTTPNSFIARQASDGVGVSTWYDISNSSVTPYNATSPSSTNYPLYVEGVINGLPVLRFDGSSDFFSYNGTVLANSNYTIFVVEQRRDGAENFFLAGQDASNNANLLLGYIDNTNYAFSQYGPYFNAAIPEGGYTIPIPRIHAYRSSTASGKDYYVNGSQITLTGVGSPNPNTPLSSYNGASIGRYASAGSYYSGDIGEIIIFNKTLNDQERKDIEEYLSKKWGITIS